ncbi:MAG: RDD family protein [Acidimicrobiia bacterium]
MPSTPRPIADDATVRVPGTAVVVRRTSRELPLTAFVARASGLGLALIGASARAAVRSIDRVGGPASPSAPTALRPVGRLVRATPGLALAAAYATRAGALAVLGTAESVAMRTVRGVPSVMDTPLHAVASTAEDINRWAFGTQRHNELLLQDFVRRSAPEVAQQLVTQIDLPAVVRQVPVQAIAQEIDLTAVIQSIDLNQIIAGINIRPIADQVIDELDIPSIVRATTSSMASDITNAGRIGLMRVDDAVGRSADWCLRRSTVRTAPLSGYDPFAPEDRREGAPERAETRRRGWVNSSAVIRSPYARGRQGAHAGIASRGLSATVDLGVLASLTFLGLAGFGFVRSLIMSRPISIPNPGPTGAFCIAFGLALVYYVSSWATTGRTLGDAIFGLRVVTANGKPLGVGRALVRAVLVFFVGPLLSVWCIVSRRNNALYDEIVRTTVLYDWTIA